MTYTSHGHRIPNSPVDNTPPEGRARCGGPGLCAKCTQESQKWAEDRDLQAVLEKIAMEGKAGHTPVPSARRYVAKPIEIVAIQFSGGDALGHDLADWINGNGGNASYMPAAEPFQDPENPENRHDGWPARLQVLTGAGYAEAAIGDWLINGPQGEFYPCPNDVFVEKYEPKE